MKRILAIILSVIVATCAFAQEHLEFMGIPMENECIFKHELEQKNFHLFNGGVFNFDMKSEDLGDKGFIIGKSLDVLRINISKLTLMEQIARKDFHTFCENFAHEFISSECMMKEFRKLTCGDAQQVKEHLKNYLVFDLYNWLKEKEIDIED